MPLKWILGSWVSKTHSTKVGRKGKIRSPSLNQIICVNLIQGGELRFESSLIEVPTFSAWQRVSSRITYKGYLWEIINKKLFVLILWSTAFIYFIFLIKKDIGHDATKKNKKDIGSFEVKDQISMPMTTNQCQMLQMNLPKKHHERKKGLKKRKKKGSKDSR